MVAAAAAYHQDEDDLFAHLERLDRTVREYFVNASNRGEKRESQGEFRVTLKRRKTKRNPKKTKSRAIPKTKAKKRVRVVIIAKSMDIWGESVPKLVVNLTVALL